MMEPNNQRSGAFAEHARAVHGMNEVPKEMYDRARSGMHEVEEC